MTAPTCPVHGTALTCRRCELSRAGKAGRGKAKARDPEKMRAAARKRWANQAKPPA